MVNDFIEARRTVKRLKKLPPLDEDNLLGHAEIKHSTKQGNVYQHTVTGYRPDLGIVLRSGWESNILRVLKIHGIQYEYEPRTYYFPVKRGTKAYRPDIWLPKTDELIEIKGYFDDKSRVKLKWLKKYYPKDFEKLILIISRSSAQSKRVAEQLQVNTVLYYEDFRDLYKEKIANWEGR